MKLKDVWKKKEVTLSFEAFPPKKDSQYASVASAVEKIAQLNPDYMIVTYGSVPPPIRERSPRLSRPRG